MKQYFRKFLAVQAVALFITVFLSISFFEASAHRKIGPPHRHFEKNWECTLDHNEFSKAYSDKHRKSEQAKENAQEKCVENNEDMALCYDENNIYCEKK